MDTSASSAVTSKSFLSHGHVSEPKDTWLSLSHCQVVCELFFGPCVLTHGNSASYS